MEEISFTSLAPRSGTRPMLSAFAAIGASQMNGGAFSFSSILNGIKNFGSRVVNFGSTVWNSAPASALKQKLNDSNLQEKIVHGLSNGIHGVVDLANQEIERAIANRVEKRPLVEGMESVLIDPPATGLAPPVPVVVEQVVQPVEEIVYPSKKPRKETPPPYEDLYHNEFPSSSMALVTQPQDYPSSLKVDSGSQSLPSAVTAADINEISHVTPTTVSLPVKPVTRPIVRDTPSRPLRRPIPRRQNTAWQQTLGNIVGVGVKVQTKRRCY